MLPVTVTVVIQVFDRTKYASAEGVTNGAYIISDCAGTPDVILIATGSEVAVALAAQDLLSTEGIKSRVISAPCLEWFADQTPAYRESVLPAQIRARVSVEAGVATGWRELVGDAGEIVSLDHFGASASAGHLFKEYGFTAENVAAAAKKSIARAKK